MRGRRRAPSDSRRVAITLDIETDWGGRLRPGPSAFRGVRAALPRMLSLLERARVKATCFVSGELVAHVTEELDALVQAGHEIASHGFCHRDLAGLCPEELRREVARSKVVLEDALQVEVRGFRAPQGRTHPALFHALAQSGYQYDSSLIGTYLPGRYRHPRRPRRPFVREGIVEVPMTVLPGLPVPIGLLWLNMIGQPAWQWLLERPGLPEFIGFYAHPFDVVVEKGPAPVSLPVRLWYTMREDRALLTFERFLNHWRARDARFVTLSQVCAEMGPQAEVPA